MGVLRPAVRTFKVFLSWVYCLLGCEVTASQHSPSCLKYHYYSYIKNNTTFFWKRCQLKCWRSYWHTVRNHCHTSHTCYCKLIAGSPVTADRLTKHSSEGSSKANEAVLGAVQSWSLFSINKDMKLLHKCKIIVFNIYLYINNICNQTLWISKQGGLWKPAECQPMRWKKDTCQNVFYILSRQEDGSMFSLFMYICTSAQNYVVNDYTPKQNWGHSHQRVCDHTYLTNAGRTVSPTPELCMHRQ